VAAARRARLTKCEDAASRFDLPVAMARLTADALRAGLRACSAATAARREFSKRNFLFDARRGLLEGDLKIVAQVGTALFAASAAATAAKEFLKNSATTTTAAKHLAENVERIVEAAATACAWTRGAALAEGRVPETIVGRALLGIAQHFVALGDRLELVLGLLVSRVLVGVILDREFAVGLLDVVSRRVTRTP
jgi:hypothetical protein